MNGRRDVQKVKSELKEKGFSNHSSIYLRPNDDQSFWYGVSLSVRLSDAPEIVWVNVYSIVIWRELEERTQNGLGLDNQFGTSATWTKFVNANASLLVGGRDDDIKREDRLNRLSRMVFENAVPLASDMCDLRKLESHVLSKIAEDKSGFEKQVVLADLHFGKDVALRKFRDLLGEVDCDFEVSQLKEFGDRYFSCI